MTLPKHHARCQGEPAASVGPVRAARYNQDCVHQPRSDSYRGPLPMHCRPAVLGVALAALSILTVSASPTRMSVDEIRPGMIGTGHTVFEGDRIEEFKVQFIGVLRNVIGPSRNLILARLEGGPLASTGVIAGMSGSPVYIDGRLVGAVSYSLGAFSKEPIAGITPIAEMVSDATLPAVRRQAARVDLPMPLTPESFQASLRQAFSWIRPFADSPADVQVLGDINAGIGTMLRPISTP